MIGGSETVAPNAATANFEHRSRVISLPTRRRNRVLKSKFLRDFSFVKVKKYYLLNLGEQFSLFPLFVTLIVRRLYPLSNVIFTLIFLGNEEI